MDQSKIINQNSKTQNIEIKLLLEAMFQQYGYDFRNYAQASIERRVLHRLNLSDCQNISEMTHRVLYDRSFFETLVHDFSISVTQMFRDPPLYRVIRTELIPVLKTYSFIRIWIPGCATGEEVYSMAILLQEEGLYERTKIYATDMNQTILNKAKEGLYPVESIKSYTENYMKAGGKQDFSDYYTARYEFALMHPDLKKNIIFSAHNLVCDEVFQEMHLVSCRNVFIYFNRDLQNRALRLFHESLVPGGFLCLGTKENLKFSEYEKHFDTIAQQERIYQKKREF